MKWREPITLTVRILSPVVIGTGERCNPMGFFVADDGRVWVVDERKFIEVLIERGLAEGFRIWLEGQLQQNRRPNLKGFFDAKEILGEEKSAEKKTEILQASVAYVLPLVSLRQRMLRFNLCLKTPDHRPYIPGSELKGAIRTAVLAKMLNDDVNLLRQLAQNLRPNMTRGQMNALWQGNEWLLLRRNQNDRDAHNDLFRGIAISDSEPLPTDALRIYAAKRLNMSRDVTVFVEAIAPNSETKVTLSVACPDRWLQAIGLTDKAGWLDWTKLAHALYEHSNAILDFIAKKFPAREFPQVQAKAQKLKEQNKPDEPLVCLGWGQGFLSITMTEPLRQKFPTAYETLRQAMAQAIRQYERTKQNNFPKTIWAALDANSQPSDLFGWVQLIARLTERRSHCSGN
jgi:CRISPR-associated protein Csm5